MRKVSLDCEALALRPGSLRLVLGQSRTEGLQTSWVQAFPVAYKMEVASGLDGNFQGPLQRLLAGK